MIALSASVALAQDGQNSNFVANGRDCLNPSAIYGTSGFANAQQALNTNATTYSASAFAERLGLDQLAKLLEDKKTRGMVIWEINETFDVARVPTYHHTNDAYITQPDCDPQYRVGNRGADLQATLLAGVFGTPHFGAFFAASQTSGQVASTDNLMRGIYWGYLYPLYGLARSRSRRSSRASPAPGRRCSRSTRCTARGSTPTGSSPRPGTRSRAASTPRRATPRSGRSSRR
jgi:hypothetical protein